ncbi:DUF2254 domain-containing protein [Nocardia panacis]|uniref:DUF2254 domain-containing protein n=1 Tax=Nocardia panacis TaxID=2340916 RepID=UPI0013158D1A|nr:DUF2254 domain-containing protein [Nocardia panacis]
MINRVRWQYRHRRVWRIPAAIVAGALLLAWAVPALDRALAEEFARVPVLGTFDAGVMATVLSSVASGTITFSGFVFSVVLLVIQFGTASMSARWAPRLTQDWVLGAALGTFMATFTYSLLISVRLGARVEDYQPVLSSIVAVGLALASVVLFFALLTRVVNFLRLVKSLDYVGRVGMRTAAHVHPDPFGTQRDPAPDADNPDRVIRCVGRGGVLLGIDTEPVAALAAAAGVRITLLPAIGDYVLPDAPLFAVHGGSDIDARRLRRHVVFGIERVVDADPAFALRVMVDMAIKALSPAINDPTTATQALDHIGALLLDLAGRDLGVTVVRDENEVVRLVLRNSDWVDYLALAVDEIRYYGASSLQVVRRLRALYSDLLRLCPAARLPSVAERLAALEADIPANFRTALDRANAGRPDWQGLGGPAA